MALAGRTILVLGFAVGTALAGVAILFAGERTEMKTILSGPHGTVIIEQSDGGNQKRTIRQGPGFLVIEQSSGGNHAVVIQSGGDPAGGRGDDKD